MIAIVAALGLASTAAASSAANPSVRFAHLVPAQATGLHFKSGEKVWVTLRAGASTVKRMTHASAQGVIAVDFGRLADKDRCSGAVSLVALGASGDRAAYKLPLLACPTSSSGSGSYTR